MLRLTQAELAELLEAKRSRATVRGRFLREFIGGQPAPDKALEAYIEFHLKIPPMRNAEGKPTNAEFIKCFARIKGEEIGERDVTPPGGEVEEKKVYGVNVIRKSAAGPFLLEHQVKAVLKQAASRLGLFMAKKGSKGDLAELGTVLAFGPSLLVPARPWEIYLLKDGKPAPTVYVTMRGSVDTPSGRKSIQYEAEAAPEGSEFAFELRWPDTKLKAKDVCTIVAAATSIGIGSCLSLGYGRWEVLEMEVEEDEKK